MKNIDSIKYFLEKWETVDTSHNYTVPYHKDIDTNFTSLPTFVAEFYDCKVHSCPLLVTYQQKLITNHIWSLTNQRRNKPGKSHKLWKEWGEEVKADLPPVSQHFHEKYHYVWLPIDEESVGNPWHIWIDVISIFRLIEKRWSTDFTKYCYVLSNEC